MGKISNQISESLSEYLILTGWIKTKPEDVSLQAKLGENIFLQYPLMTARMQCVVGPDMAIAAGRQGILTCIPRSLRNEDKQAIIDANKSARLKKGDIEFQENPEYANLESTLEEVTKQVERIGHSVMPILDRFSKLYGFYIHDPNHPLSVPPYTSIKDVMIPLKTDSKEGIPFSYSDDEGEIKQKLSHEDRRFIPIVNKEGILQKLAFLQRYDTNFIGIAISTRDKYEEDMERWGPQADTLMIDSSNACFDNAVKILKTAKKKFPDKPFGIGNIIKGEDFLKFAKAGADYIMGGMGVGSICQTGSERGNGRGQFTVAKELAEARDQYYGETGIYTPFVLDGSIGNVKDMSVALAFADLIMMGNYFNRFYEAAAQKFEEDKPTSEETLIRYVETWGEGHPRARLVGMYGMNFRQDLKKASTEDPANVTERYGHSGIASATVEGVVGRVPYRGRLKPCIERDARYIRTTISNTGASDLASFREKAIVEKASQRTLMDMLPHDIEVTER